MTLARMIEDYTREAGAQLGARDYSCVAKLRRNRFACGCTNNGQQRTAATAVPLPQATDGPAPTLATISELIVVDAEQARQHIWASNHTLRKFGGNVPIARAVTFAWTPAGGDIIFIEATKCRVVKVLCLPPAWRSHEMARAALSYIRAEVHVRLNSAELFSMRSIFTHE